MPTFRKVGSSPHDGREDLIEFGWYQKEVHSGHTISKSSIQTTQTKRNNLITSFKRIITHTNNETNYKAGIKEMIKKFTLAG